jgi:hypothetical protein
MHALRRMKMGAKNRFGARLAVRKAAVICGKSVPMG